MKTFFKKILKSKDKMFVEGYIQGNQDAQTVLRDLRKEHPNDQEFGAEVAKIIREDENSSSR